MRVFKLMVVSVIKSYTPQTLGNNRKWLCLKKISRIWYRVGKEKTVKPDFPLLPMEVLKMLQKAMQNSRKNSGTQHV